MLRGGPSAGIWTFCKTGTIDACERRGLIRDTGRRDSQVLRVFELTAAGRDALHRAPSLVGRDLWDRQGGMGVE